jgi:hypothetical protein
MVPYCILRWSCVLSNIQSRYHFQCARRLLGITFFKDAHSQTNWKYYLLNIYSANGSGWYITITRWNNYNGNIEVVSYIMECSYKNKLYLMLIVVDVTFVADLLMSITKCIKNDRTLSFDCKWSIALLMSRSATKVTSTTINIKYNLFL